MGPIITNLLFTIQYQRKQIQWLLDFMAKYIPLKQWAHDEIHSPKYQKFKTDKLPIIRTFIKQDWKFLLAYYEWKLGKPLKPVKRHKDSSILEETVCPRCGAPHHYLYDNNGGKGQFQCKVCGQTFSTGEIVTSPLKLICPYCGHALSAVKSRKFFVVHKCTNKKCSYYLHNLKALSPEDLKIKFKYKLHYIYREFLVDFFTMDLDSLPKNASAFKFRKNNAYIMSLCLTFHVNLGLSLRKTSQALKDLYNLDVSHTMVANYCKTAAVLVKPFVDHYDYNKSNTFVADETYIKVRGLKAYVWFVMDAISRSVIGYQVSDNRTVGPCILAMRMAFRKIKVHSESFRFIADGYPAYPLAAQQFALQDKDPLIFDITQVIGLSNDDEVSKEFRPFKQMVERLNRTFKSTYRCSCGYDNYDGANYAISLWVAYYNFLRPHRSKSYRVLNHVEMLDNASNMPGKWQLLLYLGQQTILSLQNQEVVRS